MTFREELKQWRAEHGLTQNTAAMYLDVKLRTLEDWELGRYEPSHIGPIRRLMAAHPKPKKRA